MEAGEPVKPAESATQPVEQVSKAPVVETKPPVVETELPAPAAKPADNVTIFLTGYGGYDKMKVVNTEKPEKPQRNELLIHVQATGLNFAELMARQGVYDRIPKLPAILGFEAAGEVLAVGEDVANFKVGDRVIAIKHFGLWQEYVCVPETGCIIMPEGMSFEEGAAIPVNYVTAYHMLFDFGNLRRGQSVLVHMAAGGVGTAATQLCKTVEGVKVFGTASAGKHDTIRKLGVDYPIDYRNTDYVQEIRKIDPEGVNIVLDPLCGADAVKGYQLLKPLGKIIHYGAASAVSGPNKSLFNLFKTYWNMKSYSPLEMMGQNHAACGYHMGHLIDHPQIIHSAMSDILSLYRQGKIKPQIDSVWSFEDVGKAMTKMHERQNVGKVILTPRKPAA